MGINGDGLFFQLTAMTLNNRPISKKKLMYGSLLVLADYDFKKVGFVTVSESPNTF